LVRLGIATVCFPSLGGSGVVASELAVGLAERGHDVHLVASALPSRVAGSRRLTFHEVTVPEYPLFEHAPYALAVASKLIALARRTHIDLIHVHYAVPHAASAYLARQALGAGAPRVVVSLHGTDVTVVGADPRLVDVTAFSVRAADGVTAPSRYLEHEACSRLGLSDVNIELLPNFVDTDRFTPPAARAARDAAVLFHVSNFRPVKRVGDLLEVLLRVRRELPARLVAVGDGPERAGLEARAAELGLGEAVQFLGKRDDFVDLLREADAFVLPSETESFGVAALESLSAGVPVFAYRVGGLPEVVSDDVGRLVEPYDVDALARAVIDGIGDRARLSRAARARAVASFQRGPALQRVEATFRRILEQR
jgi:N-acetyl-alpha-D-glucosaminyl L-malate synthase BshA